MQHNFTEVVATLIPETFDLLANHRIRWCILYTLKQDCNSSEHVACSECCMQRVGSGVLRSSLGATGAKRLAGKAAHHYRWFRMSFVQTLQRLFGSYVTRDAWNIWVHWPESFRQWWRPFSSANRNHTCSLKTDSSNPHARTQVDHIAEWLTGTSAIQQDVSRIVHYEDGHRILLNHGSVENWDGRVSRNLQRSQNLRLDPIGQNCNQHCITWQRNDLSCKVTFATDFQCLRQTPCRRWTCTTPKCHGKQSRVNGTPSFGRPSTPAGRVSVQVLKTKKTSKPPTSIIYTDVNIIWYVITLEDRTHFPSKVYDLRSRTDACGRVDAG